MIKKICLAVFALAMFSAQAQIEELEASPFTKVEQTVGLTKVTLEYSRPAMRGRVIFGELVPFDKLYRTGANVNTKISFDKDVTINGKELKAGTYAIFTKPGKMAWEVIFYTDASNWGTPREWDYSKVALTITAKVKATFSPVESFTMSFKNLSDNAADLEISWENTSVNLNIGVYSDKEVVASIEKTLAGPTAQDYALAARYYLSKKDFDKALSLIDKAVDKSKGTRFDFSYSFRKAQLLAQKGDYKAAIKQATDAKSLAEKAGKEAVVKRIVGAIAGWSKN